MSWPPRWLTEADGGSNADKVIRFIEGYCRVTKDSVAGRSGELIVLRPWQRQLIESLYRTDDAGRLRYRTGLIGVARKNGKSALGSGLALHGLYLGPKGGEVYSVAGTRQQARIVFESAKRMIELSPELAAMTKVYRDAVEVPSTGSVYRPLSSEAGAQEGLSPTLTIFDEVHVQPNDELWNVMALGSGAREQPMLLGITTAGVRTDSSGQDSLCYRLYQHGCKVATGEVDDPSFFMAWWEPFDKDQDHTLEATWQEANPGYGDIVSKEDFESQVKRTPESEFRTKRCNQWVASATTWLPAGRFEQLEGSGVELDADVVLAFDGSYSGDSTAIVGATIEEHPRVFTVKVWEAPDDDIHWRVPIDEVEQTLRDECRRRPVKLIGCDPYRWQRSLQLLEEEGLPVVEFPQSPARMIPATKQYTDLVMDGQLSHDGDPALVRHHRNAVLKQTPRGAQLSKDTKTSSRKIDAAVCAVMAVDLTARLVADDSPAIYVGFS